MSLINGCKAVSLVFSSKSSRTGMTLSRISCGASRGGQRPYSIAGEIHRSPPSCCACHCEPRIPGKITNRPPDVDRRPAGLNRIRCSVMVHRTARNGRLRIAGMGESQNNGRREQLTVSSPIKHAKSDRSNCPRQEWGRNQADPRCLEEELSSERQYRSQNRGDPFGAGERRTLSVPPTSHLKKDF